MIKSEAIKVFFEEKARTQDNKDNANTFKISFSLMLLRNCYKWSYTCGWIVTFPSSIANSILIREVLQCKIFSVIQQSQGNGEGGRRGRAKVRRLNKIYFSSTEKIVPRGIHQLIARPLREELFFKVKIKSYKYLLCNQMRNFIIVNAVLCDF